MADLGRRGAGTSGVPSGPERTGAAVGPGTTAVPAAVLVAAVLVATVPTAERAAGRSAPGVPRHNPAMLVPIAGLVIFLGVHSVSIVAP